VTGLTRRTQIALLAAAASGTSLCPGKDTDMFKQILEDSQAQKKGVMLYIKGQTLPGLVTKLNADSVEMRSQQYSRIVVRLDSIDAVAMS
jgi:hypothetical protein